MKKYGILILCLVTIACCLYISCSTADKQYAKEKNDIIDINETFIVKDAVLHDHEYYIIISGNEIMLEHKVDCKECLNMFD